MSNISVILKLAFVLAIYILSVNGMNENEKLAIAKLRELFSKWNKDIATWLDECSEKYAEYDDVVVCANGVFQKWKAHIVWSTDDLKTAQGWIDTYINDVQQATGGALKAPLADILTQFKTRYEADMEKHHQS